MIGMSLKPERIAIGNSRNFIGNLSNDETHFPSGDEERLNKRVIYVTGGFFKRKKLSDRTNEPVAGVRMEANPF